VVVDHLHPGKEPVGCAAISASGDETLTVGSATNRGNAGGTFRARTAVL
jgi:hypothetical protein